VLALAVVGGGLYGGYRWTQTQYYIGTNSDSTPHVALYRGISQDLAWVKLSQVETDYPDIELKYLPQYQRTQIDSTITASSLDKAQAKVKEFATQASACKREEARRAAEGNTPTKPTTGSTGTQSNKTTTASPTPGPSLSEDEQKLVSQCGKQ
jgi:protein phosphatase